MEPELSPVAPRSGDIQIISKSQVRRLAHMDNGPSVLYREIQALRKEIIRLKDVLKEIGNIAGTPTTGYAPNLERKQQRRTLNMISALVQRQIVKGS